MISETQKGINGKASNHLCPLAPPFNSTLLCICQVLFQILIQS